MGNLYDVPNFVFLDLVYWKFKSLYMCRNIPYLCTLFLTFPFLIGTSLPMVDPESEGEIFPDIQFWKQCADPILAQDPFSSLMSALFCLPVEVLTSTEFFIPIVHLFYIVCVIQVYCSAISHHLHISVMVYFSVTYALCCRH